MTGKTRKILGYGAALGLAAVLSVGTAHVLAQGRPGGPGGRGGPGRGPGGGFGFGGGLPFGEIMQGLRGLDLSDAQREQVRSVMQGHKTEFDALAERGRTAGKALQEAVTADVMDESAIRDRSAAVAAVQADGAVLAARVRAEVFALLTPEQQTKAKELRATMEKRMQERMQQRQQRRSNRNQPAAM